MAKSRSFEEQKGKGITSTEQARALGRLGGIAKQKALKVDKLFKQVISEILIQKAPEEMTQRIRLAFDLKGVELTLKDALVYSQVFKAISEADTTAFNAIIDRLEGKPNQTMDVSTEDKRRFSSVSTIDGKKVIELK